MQLAKSLLLCLGVLTAAAPRAAFATDSCTSSANDYCVTYQNGTTYTFMPAYSWAAGCGPTAAAMVLGYWDNLGNYGSTSSKSKYGQYGKLINYYVDNTVITSQAAYGGGGNYELGGNFSSAHPDLLLDLADAYNTTADGGSSTSIIATGINSVANGRGYSGTWSTWYSTNSATNDWGWAIMKTEIEKGYPFVWAQVGADSGHGIAAWGYKSDTKDIIVYDTWNDVRQDWHYTWYCDDPADAITLSQVNTVHPQNGTTTSQDVLFYTTYSGEWKGYSQQTIWWWQYGSDITTAKLSYSTDGGASWTQFASVASAVCSTVGNSYVWTVPNTITSTRVRLKVEGYNGATLMSSDGTQSNITITPTPPPVITGNLNPTSTSVGGMVVINGYDFGTEQGTSYVRFYNNKTPTIVDWTDTQILAIVPTGATSGNVTVTKLSGSSSKYFTLGLPESPHNPYPNAADFDCVYTFGDGTASAVDITFDANTNVEANHDYIQVGNIYQIDGSPFTGSTLAGHTYRVSQGATVKVKLTANSSNNNYYGFKVNSVTEADITAPGAPSGLNASPSGYTNSNYFTVNWTNPSDPSGIAGAYYKLGSAPTSDLDNDGYFTAKPFTVSATAEGGQILYVWLQDGVGNKDYTHTATTMLYYDGTSPAAPTGLTAAPAAWTNVNSFSINWTNPSSDIGGVYYKRGTPPTFETDYEGYTAGSNIHSLTVSAASQGGQHIYIWLRDNVGNKNFQSYTGVTLHWDATAPYNPNSISEVSALQSNVWQNTISDPNFNWSGAYDMGGAELDGYSVYWGPDPAGEPGAASEQAGLNYDPTSFTGVSYLRVRTFDTAGNMSGPATLFTAKYDGTAPTNPGAAAETGGMAAGVWQNSVNDPNFTWSGAADTGGSGLTGYSVYWGTAAAGEPGLSLEQTDALYDPGTFSATFYLRVRTFDEAGNKSDPAAIFTAKYDGTSPSAPFLNETVCGSSWCRYNTPSFSWAKPADTGGSGVTAYYGIKDGGSTITITSPYVPSPAWADGEHTFQLYAADAAGNTSVLSNLKTVRIDTQLPVSTCAALAAYLPALFTVEWSGADTGSSQLASYDVQYKLGAGSWTDWAPATALTSRTFGPATDGTYYFRVRARDAAGNVELYPTAADAMTIVDASSPTAPSITSPSNHQPNVWNTVSNSPQFNFPASDGGSGLDGYSVALDRSANFVLPLSVNLTGNSTGFTNISDGSWYFYARAKDRAGNWGAVSSYGPIKIDLTPPSFTGILPAKNPAPAGSLAITVTASEQLSVISATVTQSGGTPTPVALTSQDNITWTGSYSVAAGLDGSASIAVWGKDLPGKSGSGSTTFTVDSIAPSNSSITSATHPQNTPTSRSATVFGWTTSADSGTGLAGYSYAINHTAGYALDTATDTAAVSLSTALPDGTWWLHLRAVDNAGNGSAIAGYKFIVDVTSPVYAAYFSRNPANAGPLSVTLDAGEALTGAPAVTVKQLGGATVPLTMTSSDNAVWTGNYAVATGGEGSAVVSMTGVDLAGNTGAATSGFQVDTVEPTAAIALSPSGALKNGAFSLTMTLTDASAITGTPLLSFTPPGQAAVALTLTGSDKNWAAQGYIETTMSTGTAVFALSAADAAGNTGSVIASGASFAIDTSVSGAAGGTVTNSDDTGVVITPGAFAGSLILSIGTPDQNLPDIVDADRNTPRASPVSGVNLRRKFSAWNSVTGAPVTTFSLPITLFIPYPDADSNGLVDGPGVRETKLKLFWLNPVTKRWEEVTNAAVDFAGNKFTASVTHFSIYAILTVAPESVIYPVPWKPGSGGPYDSASDVLCGTGMIFDFLPADARILIYNYQGDLIRELALTSADNGCKAWNGKNSAGRDVASGIYLAVIKTATGGRTVRKLAIER